jgi:hypothetical protein
MVLDLGPWTALCHGVRALAGERSGIGIVGVGSAATHLSGTQQIGAAMTTSEDRIVFPPISGGLWDAASRLATEFPSLAPTQIAAVLIEVRRGAGLFGLNRADEIAMTEKIARERLIELTATADMPGESPRLDPESHHHWPAQERLQP